MNKKMLLIVAVIGSVLIICLYMLYKDNNKLNIISLTEDKLTDSQLNFNLLYTAPHLPYIKIFNYDFNKNEFTELSNHNYAYSVNGFVDTNELDILLNGNLEDYIHEYGQVNFIKQIDNKDLIVFDGWRLGTVEEDLVSYTAVVIDNNEIEVYNIKVNNRFTASNVFKFNDEYYIVGGGTDVITTVSNPGGEFYKFFTLYNMHNNEQINILNKDESNLINSRNAIFSNNHVLTTYIDATYNEYLIAYCLEENKIIHEINLTEFMYPITRYSGVNHIIPIDDMLLCFYQVDFNNIGMIKINDNFEVVESTLIQINYFHGVVDMYHQDDNIYILTSRANIGNLNKFDINNYELIELLEFEAINNKDTAFLMDIFFIMD